MITGGMGLIGSALARRLVALGANVLLADETGEHPFVQPRDLLARVPRQFGIDPLLGSIHAEPFNTFAGDELDDFHIVETVVPESKLIVLFVQRS